MRNNSSYRKVLRKICYALKKFGFIYTVEIILVKLKLKRELSLYSILRHQKYFEGLNGEGYKQELCDIYLYKMGEEINLDRPVLFTEKILWLILHDNTPKKTKLADKYLVREWIKNQIGEQYLIPLLGVWDDFRSIDFGKLPEKFVLKCNHGSGYNYIVKNKDEMNYKKVKKKFENWMKINFAFCVTLEFQYANIPRRIIAEKYIKQLDGNLLDYKVHCFMGEPRYIQVIGDRNLLRHTGSQLVFDAMWNEQSWGFGDYPKFSRKIQCPDILEQMLNVSRKLSREFMYVRVDFYIVENELKFGEMTFTPGGGIYRHNKDWTCEIDRELGDLIDISRVAV